MCLDCQRVLDSSIGDASTPVRDALEGAEDVLRLREGSFNEELRARAASVFPRSFCVCSCSTCAQIAIEPFSSLPTW